MHACRIRLLPAEALRELLHELPAVRDHVLRHVAAQVNRDRRARIRVAASRPATPGPSRVTVNRALRVLAAAGAVRTEPGAVVVLDPFRLAAAGGALDERVRNH
ncbi:hypothetical protein ABZ570_27785 [Micromonospora sp. NPDC007271]|uniref:hypothetical protein n=1 Tax=Micromonospora sp. NPDC007271 TaxID=3154587 RepID=UPI0033C8A533